MCPIVRQELQDNLRKVERAEESEIPGICKAKAVRITELIESEFPYVKIVTHVQIGHKGEQSYHEELDSHYELWKDWCETMIEQSDKFWVESNIAVIPLKVPEEYECVECKIVDY